ncbi:LOW QUALITY PROTEIN: protein zer-1 homolog [Tubulanus polymorphus]|uniref:LOW QUALITY PROTEIN: protein zer-1 homolog n=1 Tax=Tubulanus polymorphus TaxID=672921 RepID=UPI003DA2CF03
MESDCSDFHRRNKDGAVASLQDLCLEQCVLHLDDSISYVDDCGNYSLREGVVLPGEICESLFNKYIDMGYVINNSFVRLFEDTTRTKLHRANLCNSEIGDEGFEILARHGLFDVDLSFCPNVSERVVHLINKYCRNLRALRLTDSPRRLFDSVEISPPNDEAPPPAKFGRDFIFDCRELRLLSLHSIVNERPDDQTDLPPAYPSANDLIAVILNPLDKLSYLDLSKCDIDISSMHRLADMKYLVSLILYDVRLNHAMQSAVDVLTRLKRLRHLDLSQDCDISSPVKYPNASVHVANLVRGLPELRSLDLSGTDLPGIRPYEPTSHRLDDSTLRQESESKCPIDGLEGRYFDFLGLFQCVDSPCQRENIPAKQITGDANEEQLILSVKMYVDREGPLLKALDRLFLILRHVNSEHSSAALQALLLAMKRHPLEKHIQISTSASIFYLVRLDRKWMTLQEKRQTIKLILDAMENHPSEDTTIRNCGLTLCQFSIPQDLLYHYERTVRILLNVIDPNSGIYHNLDDFVQRIGIYLLNSLACQVDGKEKQLVGDLGAVAMMLKVIEYKLNLKVCDEILEVAWSTMWNITDETPKNCSRFLEGCGMKYFIRCLDQFPDEHDLLRNMMGLMGNVAENFELRPKLMQKEYVQVFSHLLDSDSDGIEVSYNASGVLAHMASDGADAWTLADPSLDDTLNKMVAAIERWDINSKRNINYRSFEPILSLLNCFDTPASQHWATWALCNLTSVYPQKYCKLVEKENGISLLNAILNHDKPYERIRIYAQKVVENIRKFNAGELPAPEDEPMNE